MEYYPRSHVPTLQEFIGTDFVHFMHAGNRIKERIYLNVHPNHAVEVMRFVVQEVRRSLVRR
jgi:hypothetical protein